MLISLLPPPLTVQGLWQKVPWGRVVTMRNRPEPGWRSEEEALAGGGHVDAIGAQRDGAGGAILLPVDGSAVQVHRGIGRDVDESGGSGDRWRGLRAARP